MISDIISNESKTTLEIVVRDEGIGLKDPDIIGKMFS